MAILTVLMFLPLPATYSVFAQTALQAHDLSGVWQLAPGGGGQGPGDNVSATDALGTGKVRCQQARLRSESGAGWQRSDPEMRSDGFPAYYVHDLAF